MQQHQQFEINPTAASVNNGQNMPQKIALAVVAIGLLLLFLSAFGVAHRQPALYLLTVVGLVGGGGVAYAYWQYKNQLPGIKNNGVWFTSLTARGAAGWLTGMALTGFYVLLYWFPQWLGQGQQGAANHGLIALFDPLSLALKNKPASQWFVYGALYTLAVLIMGVKFMLKYRHSRYQLYRTASVMFFQVGFAFLLPELMQGLNLPYYDFKNMWPLNYYFFDDWHLNQLLSSGNIGLFMLVWGVLMVALISPALTYFYGKRWYCSWVCGCGALAETAGDPFRHLSDKSLRAWQLERWLVYGILVLVIITTALVLYTYFTGAAQIGFINSYTVRQWYGFWVGAVFSGVIGVGFYPILGSRVWCRFGCPMAAILGIQQRLFSRFRITTNGGLCISCGNCSAYCEMGIDVRAYAQKGQNIVRAACVGCGICADVCPRGVLKLENAAHCHPQNAINITHSGAYLNTETN